MIQAIDHTLTSEGLALLGYAPGDIVASRGQTDTVLGYVRHSDWRGLSVVVQDQRTGRVRSHATPRLTRRPNL